MQESPLALASRIQHGHRGWHGTAACSVLCRWSDQGAAFLKEVFLEPLRLLYCRKGIASEEIPLLQMDFPHPKTLACAMQRPACEVGCPCTLVKASLQEQSAFPSML